MNKQEMLSQMDAVRAAIEDCLDDQARIIAINNVDIASNTASVHLSSLLDLGRCFDVDINIDKDFGAGRNRCFVMAHGVEFFCLAPKPETPIEDIDVPAETLSGLSGQEVSP